MSDQLQTSNGSIYAVGDCCTAYKFTHVADFMARMVVRNALFFAKGKMSAMLIPWTTFTQVCACRKRKEKTTPFGVNLMRSQVLYWAAQGYVLLLLLQHLLG